MQLKIIPRLVKKAALRWWDDHTFRLGAALAYYTVFSLAPILLIAVAIAGFIFGKATAQQNLSREIKHAVGPQVGQAVETMLHYVRSSGSGVLATVLGAFLLVLASTTVFAQLQDALNTIWGIKPRKGRGFWGTIKDRFWSFTVVVGIGLLLLLSLVLSTALSALSRFLPSVFSGHVYLWQVLDWLLSFGLVTLLFALIYKLLPDAEIEWEDVWIGAVATAVLFTLGKYLISLYLGKSSWISAYGAAGSLVVILLWVYYSSQIFLYGAELTYVFANHSGKPLRPKKNAEPLTEEARARQGMERRPRQ